MFSAIVGMEDAFGANEVAVVDDSLFVAVDMVPVRNDLAEAILLLVVGTNPT
jgi:hypothetical protein